MFGHSATKTRIALMFTAALLLAIAPRAQQAIDPARLKTAIEALERLKGTDLETNSKLKASVLRILDATRGTPQFVQIVRDFQITGQSTNLLEIAQSNATNSIGAEAIRMVLESDDTNALQGALRSPKAESTIQALGSSGSRKIVPLLQPLLTASATDLKLKQAAVRALAKNEEGATWLLNLARSKQLGEDVMPVAKLELTGVAWPDVKHAADELFADGEARKIPPIAELMKMKGDAARGAEIYKRPEVGCANCHQVNDFGIDFGPKLSEIGAKLGKDALYQSILEPNAGIAFGYEAWEVATKDDEEATGIIVSETADEVTLKNQGGISTVFKKNNLARRDKMDLSIMPAGLEQTMTLQELADLVEYLSTLRKATN